jgi:hypothetical protein
MPKDSNGRKEPTRPRGGLIPAAEVLAAMPGLFDDLINPADIGYTHPVFLQCFLPTRHSEKNRQFWQTDCGRMSLVIQAGVLANPAKPREFKKCAVPAGPKARFVVAYVNDYLQCHDTDIVNLGDSFRDAMERLHIPVGGANAAALQRELENFAAAHITIAGWSDEKVIQKSGRVADEICFWLEKDRRQRSIWQPEMKVSPEYRKAIRDGDRLAPFLWPAMLGLQHDVRGMDIHQFLVYRLKKGLRRPVRIHVRDLHALFGRDIEQRKHFWHLFKKSLAAALKWYPEARVEVNDDCIVLNDSPPLIPYRKLHRIP